MSTSPGTTLKDRVRNLIPSALWQALRNTKLRWIKWRFPSRIATFHIGGHPLRIRLDDPQGEEWYGRDSGVLTEIALMRQGQLGTGATVFDIGAHQGVVALQIAHEVGSTGTVVAVEANPYQVKIATENRDLNNASQIHVVHAAVAATPGELKFSGLWDGQSIGQGTVTVPAITVDELAAKYGQPHVLYIDVEGYECEVLKGAAATLPCLPDLYIEVHVGQGLEDFGGSLDQLLAYIPADKYTCHAILPAGPGVERDEVVPFQRDLPWLNSRFFLVALAHR